MWVGPCPPPWERPHSVAGGVAGHMATGHEVELCGAVRGVGADALLALGGVNWRAGLGAQGGANEAGTPTAPRPAPEPAHDLTLGPPPSSHHTPSTTPGHLVLSVLKNTHALGHLGERKEECGSDTRGRWGHWAQGACKRGMQAPGGSLFTPPAPHATARACYPPPVGRPQAALGAGPSSCPSPPGPLTTRVHGAAPSRYHLALHIKSQSTQGRLLLAQAGVAL